MVQNFYKINTYDYIRSYKYIMSADSEMNFKLFICFKYKADPNIVCEVLQSHELLIKSPNKK